MLVLALESSTSSAKALLYDNEKGIVGAVQKTYGALNQEGRTDTEGVYELTAALGKQLARGREIAAVALCGTWHGLSVLSENMLPVTPTFSWNFTDTAPVCDEILKDGQMTERFYENTGCMPHNTYPRHVLTYLKNQGFPLAGKRMATQGGYNFFRLTGEFLETCCTQSGSGLLNLQKLDYDDFVLDYLGIRREQLGTLCSYKDVRPLTKEGAEMLGIRPGIPVVPAHADGALNQVGSYANRKGVMTMSVGTSGAIRMTAERPVLPKGHQLWCYRGVDHYISGAAVAGACSCIDWFVKKFLGGKADYDTLEAGQIPGKKVPVFLPFILGERCPGWRGERRGGFRYVDGTHTVFDFYRAVQMGVLFNLYQCYETLCRENGAPEEILVSGGIGNSARWIQMAADIFGHDILVADFPSASCMGAAALALHAAGVLKNIDEFKADYESARPVNCRQENRMYYLEHYERYLTAYKEDKQ
ncbi:gluconokinase [Fusibacillus kribbianus]|uniref:FGGY-family carbohydrate kinase n=1 Tax=Fusibacillus kribbianus TaxID=3044208 RepID=A0AAP4BA89_9FIRM|nr:FGGY-family carbohydrate kinase [Ruminococcus sp. YH-rum2234]MDI9241732.1 FGGY-family carbohydrate kinase [Ruminococcus sp. YH-rum2234]